MQQQELLQVSASGEVTIRDANSHDGGNLLRKCNAILPNFAYIISQLLMKRTEAFLGKVRVYQGGSQLYEAPLQAFTYLGNNQLRVDTIIPDIAFTGAFDKLVLSPDDNAQLGDFAQVVNLNMNKPANMSLNVSWQINII